MRSSLTTQVPYRRRLLTCVWICQLFLSLWPFSSMTNTILSSFFLWKLFNHRSCEGYLKSIAYLSRKTSIH
ncbi:BgMFREP2 precursor [Biomphalaria glabrata]|nr:BgMFREP2 precursor [Biomphalaria glabrata]KAI8736077.1 BgMFREP2 precursor [Biomphalaria glabrata]